MAGYTKPRLEGFPASLPGRGQSHAALVQPSFVFSRLDIQRFIVHPFPLTGHSNPPVRLAQCSRETYGTVPPSRPTRELSLLPSFRLGVGNFTTVLLPPLHLLDHSVGTACEDQANDERDSRDFIRGQGK